MSSRTPIDAFDDDLDFQVDEDALLLASSHANQQTPSTSNSSSSFSSSSSSSSSSGGGAPSDDACAATQTQTDKAAVALKSPRPRLSYFQLITLSAYWFGWSVLMMPLLVILVPHQIVEIAGEEGKGTTLGITLLLGSVCGLFCSPAFGALSDTCKHQLGRRRPFMIVGAAISSCALFVMSLAQSLALFTFAFFILSIAMPLIMAPYSALIPDVVPEEQRGITSGWLGAFSTLGFFCGGVRASFYIVQTFLCRKSA